MRVHSECLTGDVFGSLRCDCGTQLDLALERVAAEGEGVVVYLRGHEGRGIGLGHKLRAYSLQDEGRDTVEANIDLGFPPDSREYGIGSQILVDLGVTTMRLMTNNPAKYGGIEGYGLEIVDRVPLHTDPTNENIAYLRAKQRKMGHLLDLEEDEQLGTSQLTPMGEYATIEGELDATGHAHRDRGRAVQPRHHRRAARRCAAHAREVRRREGRRRVGSGRVRAAARRAEARGRRARPTR